MIINQETLKHWGVLGMRWGQRKARSGGSSDHLATRSIRKKRLADLSNDEIRMLTTRIQLEQQYKNLNPSKIAKGKMRVKKVLGAIQDITTAAATIGAAYTLGKKIYESAAGKKIISKILKKP